jgi:hypothetical protein
MLQTQFHVVREMNTEFVTLTLQFSVVQHALRESLELRVVRRWVQR